MQGGTVGERLHGVAHEEAMEVDACSEEGVLGQLEGDADLEDEVDAFTAISVLDVDGHAV